ncbi:MAG TPA: hypothetical protein VKE51_14045 [Vicinamibacterales bacterium]|nr:hypothetical protein [Vicinamibacterales bacterium]
MKPAAVVAIASLMGVVADAQWLKQPTVGLPRNADGSPNLTAPAPRMPDGKPDLSGLWRFNPGAYAGNVVADLKPEEIKPSADALYKQRMDDFGKDDPATYKCLPQGPRAVLGTGWAKIMQTPTLLAILYEDLSYRQIFLDGRSLPTDPNPSFMGYSVGRWDGETLVVESTGFNDRSWLDFGGHPHTEALRITERFRRPDIGHLELKETFADATFYARPWTIDVNVDLVTDTEMLEYVCNENEKDYAHITGKASDAKKNAARVPLGLLATYVGSYEFHAPDDPKFVMVFNVTLSGEMLFIDVAGKDKQELIPLTDATFSLMGNRLDFVKGDHEAISHLIFHAVEGEMKAVRQTNDKK